MQYAEVSINSPAAQRRTFSYGIPSNLSIEVGQAVWVPFGEKTLQGVVLELTPTSGVEETREIIDLIEPVPLVSLHHISLARWISQRYLSPLFESLSLMLPPGFERRIITCISAVPYDPSTVSIPISSEQNEVLDYIRSRGKATLKELEKLFGVRCIQKLIPQMVRQRLVTKSYLRENVRIKPRIVRYLRLKISEEELAQVLDAPGWKTGKKVEVVRYLLEHPLPAPLPEVRQKTGCSSQTVRSLVEKGLIEIEERRVDRDPILHGDINLAFPSSLTPAQAAVFQPLRESLAGKRPVSGRPDIYLLRGVTGSGKTEIYLQALKEAVKHGKRGIVLVPEIAMTPQIIERFISFFPGKVAVLHSALTLGQQFDEWWRIKNGEFDVVIGPRSAIFAPQPDLGLIVIDEEHEWTYKQQDASPRYHTREVAAKLAELTGATLLLGSATPDVESYYRALNGEYRLLELVERATPGEGSSLPQVEVVDLRTEMKAGNLSIFSRSLFSSIDAALKNREQVLLFLNRRGTASFVECRDCGHVIRCRRCGIPLSYHFTEERLICHQCNYHIKTPQVCPACRSRKIKYLGAGTEKLEQETARVFPRARILRWDSDVVKGRSQVHRQLFDSLKSGKADILIGTQMVAKGLDLPGITLVGVISADIALNMPDFRANERTFQLLSQVAGRAGRGTAGGKVIIQTYSPEHYAVQAAAEHDYQRFYQKEIAYRRDLHNPPFGRLARLMFSHINNEYCQKETERMKRFLERERDSRGIAGISLIGPAPAFIQRLRGQYRWQLFLRAPEPSTFLADVPFHRGWTLDIDPVGTL